MKLTLFKKTGEIKDSRNRPIPVFTEKPWALSRAVSISPLEASEIAEMNLQKATASYSINVKGDVDITTEDQIEYLDRQFNVVSVKRFHDGINRLKIIQITISLTGSAV